MRSSTSTSTSRQHPLTIDPEFAAIIPSLTNDEYNGLQASIVAEGCREPIVIWDGIIIDGHNRHEICLANDIRFRVEEKVFADRDAAKVWIIQNQFSRRNLTPMQRSELAMKLEAMLTKAAESRKLENLKKGDVPVVQNPAPRENAGKTRDQVAKLAGVSHDTIGKVKTILRKGVPDLADMARADKISVNTAAKVAVLPVETQRNAVAAGSEAVKVVAKAMKSPAVSPAKFDHLPEEIRPVFEEAGTIDEMLGHLTQFAKLFNQITGGNLEKDKKAKPMACGTAMAQDFQEGTALIKQLRLFVTSRAPENICVYCRGETPKRQTCKSCMGGGWSTKCQWDNATKNQREGKV